MLRKLNSRFALEHRYVTRWFLYVFTSDSDDEADYIDGACHDYESTLRHHSSFSGGLRSSSSSMSLGGVPRQKSFRRSEQHSTSSSSSSCCGKVVQRCCCCRRSILRYLHRSQRIILSKFAHRKNLSVVKLRQSEAFVRAYVFVLSL